MHQHPLENGILEEEFFMTLSAVVHVIVVKSREKRDLCRTLNNKFLSTFFYK